MGAAATLPRGHQPAVVEEAICRLTEHPIRSGELSVARCERVAAVTVVDIEVPPTRSVADEVEPAVGAPAGLADRFGGTAGNAAGMANRAVRVERRNPQLRAVPGHVRVVPAQPRQLCAVGTDARRSEEVVPADDRARLAGAVVVGPERGDV